MTRMVLGGLCLVAMGFACKKVTEEERMAKFAENTAKAVADAKPVYDLMATIRKQLATETPACTGPAPTGLMRVSSKRLKTLTGERVDDKGSLVADNDPLPEGKHDQWDDAAIFRLPGTNRPEERFAPADPDYILKEIGDAAAAVQSARGFLVQRIDHVVIPAVNNSQYNPGSIDGQVVVFDKTGKPSCHYPYEAKTDASVAVKGKDNLDYKVLKNLQANMRADIATKTGIER